jgi:CspA family cold shock protein
MENTKTGTVKFFDETKGFGFIKSNDSNEEFFVHVSGTNEVIEKDDTVSFEIQYVKKGLNAVNVSLV